MTSPIERKLLVTRNAAAYCGFTSAGSLRKAYLDGRIEPVARRGGVGTWVWSVEDLDRLRRPASAATTPTRRRGLTPAFLEALEPYLHGSSR